MRLRECISVNTRYTRSINIERDGADPAATRPYVLTARAKQTLERILEAFSSDQRPRAWALVGPYGSGKSAFALFVHSLFSPSAGKPATAARQVLRVSNEKLYATYLRSFRNTRDVCSILVTGSPDSLGKRLVNAMRMAATRYFATGRRPHIVAELEKACANNAYSVSDVIALLEKLQAAVAKRKGRGVLLVVDELGKFLEYEARHQGASEIFLLQALAEHSVKANAAPFILITLLHQTLELYAQRFGEELKNEWRKISGRFESVPFLETVEQTIRVIQAAITQSLPADAAKRVAKECRRLVQVLKEQGALPLGLSIAEAEQIAARCYPLHPVSLLLLPSLCQKVAQNERTLFSYLGSQEPHGFQEQLKKLDITTTLPWVTPAAIYEYFILNQPGLSIDHATHRRWAEVVTALERLGDAPALQTDLIKTIGLLNIIGGQGGLKASQAILELCCAAQRELRGVLDETLSKSAIAYRKFSGEYRVWQGTDFDLETALARQRNEIARLDVGEVLTELQPTSAIVARRHAIATGTLRYFSPVFISADSIGKLFARKTPTMFFCMAESRDHVELFRKKLVGLQGAIAGAIYPTAGAVRDALVEVQALRRVQRQSQELANDPVAQKELKDRLAAAEQLQLQLVGSMVDDPGNMEWVVGGRCLAIVSKRELQVHISALLDRQFSKAPTIRNELINRDKPSSAAIAGRKKLFLAMLAHPNEPDLGIEKFPAEKAMYRSVLRVTKLHAEVRGEWRFQAPPEGASDVARIRPAWDAVMALLDRQDNMPVSLEEIYAVLAGEPYGIKEGLLPIFVLAIYQALNKEVALCESGQFVPFLTQDVLEGMLKNPAAYTLQRVQLNAVQRALHRCYSTVLLGENQGINDSLVTMLQPLAKMMLALPDYTKRTRRLTPEAAAVRDLFFAAKTPIQLVFTDLPAACGIKFTEGAELQSQAELFSKKLAAALTEIKVAYHALIGDFVEELRAAFGIDKKLGLYDLRETLRGRSQGLQALTIDQQGLKAFIGRLCDAYGDETQWIVSLATFLARKPPEKWTDEDVQAAGFRLREFVSRINDLRQLQLHYERGRDGGGKDFDAALLRLISTRKGESEALITLDQRTRQFVAKHVADLNASLDKLPSVEVKLATLVTVLEALLRPQVSDAETNTTPANKVA